MGSMNFPGVSEIGTSTGHPYAHDLTMPTMPSKDYSSASMQAILIEMVPFDSAF